jgi:hypothetical protein
MKKEFKRRDFINTCFKAGITCCALAGTAKLSGIGQDIKPDPKSLNYCGYKCPADCPLLKGTTENNVELKKKGYENFKFKEKYGIDFDPEKVFCYGCKVKDKPESIPVKSCTVRSCAISKGYDCCIQCDGLTSCNKELWKNFPTFKEQVVEMQKKYRT